ncbi:hypothetical protein LEMLEM_LOCUS12571 [Lemmus lemmus]
MNLVIDECVEMATSGQQNNIGMVVSKGGCEGLVLFSYIFTSLISTQIKSKLVTL